MKEQKSSLSEFSTTELLLQQIPGYKDWSFSFEEYIKFNEAVNDFEIDNFYDDEFMVEQNSQVFEKNVSKNLMKEYDDEPDFEEEETNMEVMILPIE